MAELFYRMAAIRAVRSVMDVAAQLLGPHQYGVGVSAGCEHIVHCMQHSLRVTVSHRYERAAGGGQNRHPQCVQRMPAPSTAHCTLRHSRARTHSPHRPLGLLAAHTAHTTAQGRRRPSRLHRLSQRSTAVSYAAFVELLMQLNESWHVNHNNTDPSTRTARPHPQPT